MCHLLCARQSGIPVFRDFGKRAMKLREAAGRDLGAAISVSPTANFSLLPS